DRLVVIGGGGRPDGLRRGHCGHAPARCHLRGQDSQRRQAWGPARGAAHEIRADPQPQDCPDPRGHDTTIAPDPGGRGDPMTVLVLIVMLVLGVLITPGVTAAQPRGKLPVVGVLDPGTSETLVDPKGYQY